MTDTTQYTRAEVRESRKIWANFLLIPSRKKAKNILDKGNGNRCCLGHGCFILGGTHKAKLEDGSYSYDEDMEFPPDYIIDRLGLWAKDGASLNEAPLKIFEKDEQNQYSSLSEVNDETNASPQRIGKYLLSVIEGGPDTPFRPLTDYPE